MGLAENAENTSVPTKAVTCVHPFELSRSCTYTRNLQELCWRAPPTVWGGDRSDRHGRDEVVGQARQVESKIRDLRQPGRAWLVQWYHRRPRAGTLDQGGGGHATAEAYVKRAYEDGATRDGLIGHEHGQPAPLTRGH